MQATAHEPCVPCCKSTYGVFLREGGHAGGVWGAMLMVHTHGGKVTACRLQQQLSCVWRLLEVAGA
jgi:hypothetical protein